MMRISDELRRTSKGRLQYSREADGKDLKDLLEKCSSPPALSSFHEEKPSPKSDPSSGLGLSLLPATKESECNNDGEHQIQKLASDDADSSIGIEKGEQDKSQKESPVVTERSPAVSGMLQGSGGKKITKPDDSAKSNKDVVCKSPDRELEVHLTTKFTEKLRLIDEVEREWDNKAKEFLQMKLAEFKKHKKDVESWQQEGLVAVSQRRLHDVQSQHNLLQQVHQSRREEINQHVQKLKESHSESVKRQDAALKEFEKQRQQLKEEKEKRELEMEQKVADIKALAKSIGDAKTSLLAILDGCQHKQYLTEAAEKTKLLMRRLAEQADHLAGNAHKSGPLDDILHRLKDIQEQSQNAMDHVSSLTAEAERKAKAAEEAEKQKQAAQQQQQQQQQQQATQGQGTAAGSGQRATSASQDVPAGQEGALAAVFLEYEQNKKLLADVDAKLQPFIGNQQMKKLRFDLQRAVNTPINAISPVSSAHLRDKLQRLRALLQGQTVEVSGKRVNPQDVPEGVLFCKNLVAKMIARKAEEQVSSSHESAFAIAAVAVGLWAEFPDVGKLLMCHLQALCPYVLPFMPPRLPQQSSADYHKSLGYNVEDGTIEPQDKYLRRMSGIMRLYAAILITAPPQGANHPHPHGIECAWIWLSRTLNLKPDPDITATAIFDMLQVTGNFLLRAYRVQFVKLLHALCKLFLPKLKEVAAGSGPVSRLETFLETTMRNSAMIPQPEGYLPPQFWYS